MHIQDHHVFNGVALNKPKLDRKAMVNQQQERVKKLRHAKYESILENNPEINLLRGMARIKDANILIITKQDGSEKEIEADHILLAVGASPAIPDIPGLWEDNQLESTGWSR
ncbi:MAG TPA: hypothetical protein ENI98_02670 [Gammaproteobacteria bacterium]|nr:hypothetical protein [Gammaproteobacteria bacterium]